MSSDECWGGESASSPPPESRAEAAAKLFDKNSHLGAVELPVGLAGQPEQHHLEHPGPVRDDSRRRRALDRSVVQHRARECSGVEAEGCCKIGNDCASSSDL